MRALKSLDIDSALSDKNLAALLSIDQKDQLTDSWKNVEFLCSKYREFDVFGRKNCRLSSLTEPDQNKTVIEKNCDLDNET